MRITGRKRGDEDPKIRIKSRWNPHVVEGLVRGPFNYDLYASDQDGNGMVVPCGKCMACRVKRTMEWSVRILDEASYYKTNTFLTLTYNDENLPKDGSLSKEEVQKYLKRLRERLDGREIKFYAAGEYGEENGRPHYHLILMNVGMKKDFNEMDKAWNKGFVYVRPVVPETVRYVTAYVQKKLSGPKAKEAYGDKLPPFNLMSKGIGKRWANENAEYLNRYKCITVKGKPVGIPRYYTKVVDIDLGLFPGFWDDGIAVTRANEKVLERVAWLEQNVPLEDEWKLVQAKRRQDELTLEQKVSMKKRK